MTKHFFLAFLNNDILLNLAGNLFRYEFKLHVDEG